jgi:hypothetical protein
MFENSTNINALCNSCEDMVCCSSECVLVWAPSIVLPSCRAAPLSEACESVWSVSWLLWLLMVTLLECCEKWPPRILSFPPGTFCIVPVILVRFQVIEFSRQNFENYQNIKFYKQKYSSSGSRAVPRERSGRLKYRHDETNGRSFQFCERA